MKTTYKKAKTARKPNYDAIRKAKEATQAAELQDIGRNAMACIAEMVAGLGQDDPLDEDAREAILQDALSVEVRSDWYTIDGSPEPVEYCILLSTGGPATRIVGELSHGEPITAHLEAQDWFTPWTTYRDADKSVLLAYARCFYFGDGT